MQAEERASLKLGSLVVLKVQPEQVYGRGISSWVCLGLCFLEEISLDGSC